MKTNVLRIAAAGVALGLSSAAFAADDTADLAAQVRVLRAQVAALKGNDPATQAEVNATIDSVLADADARSKALAIGSTSTAGYDADKGGFVINSGDFTFHPWFQLQARATVNYSKDAKHGDESQTQSGFELRRVKIGVDGKLFAGEPLPVEYFFDWNTDRHSGNLVLEEAWAKIQLQDGLWTKAGQFKDPFAHEGINSSKKLLAVEVSYLDDVLGKGSNYIQGWSLTWSDGKALQATLALTDGIGSANTNFQDNNGVAGTTGPNFGVTGRLEYLAAGDWKSYDDFTQYGHDGKELLVIGGGFDVTETGDTDVYLHTVDVQWKGGPWAVYGSYLARYTTNGAGGKDIYDPGFEVDVAYLLNKDWEVYGRYDWTQFDKAEISTTHRNVHEITVGLNYYIHGQSVKFTVDGTYLPNGAPIGDDSGDILANDGKTEALLRAQLQLLI